MKKMNKKIEITLLVLSSFFVGCLVGILVLGLAIPKEIDTSSQFVQTIDEVEDSIVSI